MLENFTQYILATNELNQIKIIFLFARWHQLSVSDTDVYADNSFKQNSVVEFLVKESMAAREIRDRLRNVCGESALVLLVFKPWVADWKGRRGVIIDKTHWQAFICHNRNRSTHDFD